MTYPHPIGKYYRQILILAPGVIASINDDHCIIANPMAAYECDGHRTWTKQYGFLPDFAPGFNKGDFVLYCAQVPWYAVGDEIKHQQQFSMYKPDEKPYGYSHSASQQWSPRRMFWECHLSHGLLQGKQKVMRISMTSYQHYCNIARNIGMRVQTTNGVWHAGSLAFSDLYKLPDLDCEAITRFETISYFLAKGEMDSASRFFDPPGSVHGCAQSFG